MFDVSSVYFRLERNASKEMHGLLSATTLNGSDNVCSSWSLAQADSWKHLISDKYILVFLKFLFFPFQTRSKQNEMCLFITDEMSLSFLQRRLLNCLDVSPKSPN